MKAGRLAVLCAAGLFSGGCARILNAVLAPQTSAASTAGQATAGLQNNLAGVDREVGRLLAGIPSNSEELQRLKASLEKSRGPDSVRRGSAQHDLDRICRPWGEQPRTPGDWMVLVRRTPDVPGKPVSAAPLPDGVPTASVSSLPTVILIGPAANNLDLPSGH